MLSEQRTSWPGKPDLFCTWILHKRTKGTPPRTPLSCLGEMPAPAHQLCPGHQRAPIGGDGHRARGHRLIGGALVQPVLCGGGIAAPGENLAADLAGLAHGAQPPRFRACVSCCWRQRLNNYDEESGGGAEESENAQGCLGKRHRGHRDHR